MSLNLIMCLNFVVNVSFEKYRVKNNVLECQQTTERISSQIRKYLTE